MGTAEIKSLIRHALTAIGTLLVLTGLNTWIPLVDLLTENLDSLHEQTGIMPYRLSKHENKDAIHPDDLQKIDFVVCVGLSHDDRGFLAWYKKHHPQGRIVALDLKAPSYLGDEDYLLEGDLQQTCLELLN